MTNVEGTGRKPGMTSRRLRAIALVAGATVVTAAVTGWPAQVGWGQATHSHSHSQLRSVTIDWPDGGESAVALIGFGQAASPAEARPVPIASVAKVMTAYVVLRDSPLSADESGFTLTFNAADVATEQADRAAGQSTVAVAAGEQLSERQALEALLLPSANNVAMALADQVGGSVPRFLQDMNAEAKRLGMRHTHYTDPSGLSPTTTSTARDQLRLARAAMRNNTLAQIVGLSQTWIPVAGIIHNTNALLGRDGFVGTKTGSDDAAGGCFMFEDIQHINGRRRVMFGVVLGQRGGPLIQAGLAATHELVDSIMDQLALTRGSHNLSEASAHMQA